MKWKLGLVIVLLLCAVMLPMMANAETSGDDGNIHWVLSDDGVLTISGNGTMKNYSSTNVNGTYVTTAPWGYTMASAIIEDGVTSISRSAFYGCSSLTSITIPEGVTSIGIYAFYGCSSLTSITIPEGVTSIGDNAFRNCSSLTTITIPEDVTSIGIYAFYGCSSLTSITIPEGVTSIGGFAFSNCSAIRYAIIGSDGAKALGKASYSFRDSQYPKISLRYDFSNGEISNFSVLGADQDIETVTFPEGVTRIGSSTFRGCSSLMGITIPDGVTSIGSYAFYGCSSLTSITIPEGVTSIGDSTFSACSNLTSIILSESVTSIGSYAFVGCRSLTGITIPEGVTSIGNSAFSGCTSLTSIFIPEGVTEIGSSTFSSCFSLTSISIPNSVASIGEHVFYSCTNLVNVTLPDIMTSIGNEAFYNCSGLTSITIPEGVTTIGDSAFRECKRLRSIGIPGSVTSIGHYAFSGCIDLTSISIPEGVTSIGVQAFYYCSSLASITIPNSVTAIGEYAFYGCSKLSKVLFYGEQVSFGNNAFNYPKPTIYCYEYSDVDSWAMDNGFPLIYLDNVNFDDIRSFSLQDDFRMPCGRTQWLEMNIFPDGEHPAIVWASSASEIVSMKDGVATAIAPGIATITATMGSVSDSVNITAYAAAEDFELSTTECWVIAKETIQLDVTQVMPIGAEDIFTWTSIDTSVATVNADGLVTTKKPGDVIITVNSDLGITKECLVHACYPVTEIAFTEDQAGAYTGIPLQLTANVSMRTQSCVNHLVTFTSSDETIATVDENGLVTPLKVGTVTITATADSGVSASCTVTVKEMAYTTLPAYLTAIEEEAFMGAAFEAVLIPDGCTSIGNRAFADCPNLVYVRIPASVTFLAEDAFEGCSQVVIDRIQE